MCVLKEQAVLAVNCPSCGFLTALTLHKCSKVSLKYLTGISGFQQIHASLQVSGPFSQICFLFPFCAEASGDQCPQ